MWLRCGIRWENTAFLHPQNYIWNSFLIWGIWTNWLWFSWSFTGARENLAASQGKKQWNQETSPASLEESGHFLPGVRSIFLPTCVCPTPSFSPGIWALSQILFIDFPQHPHQVSGGYHWADVDVEAQRNSVLSWHVQEEVNWEEGMWILNIRLRAEIGGKVLVFTKVHSVKEHAVWGQEWRDAIH